MINNKRLNINEAEKDKGEPYMNIKITSDSTCDLSTDILQLYNISLLPLHIEKGGKIFQDGIDIYPDDIFYHVSNGGTISTTSAVNPLEYKSFFEQFVNKYDAVIHINIGSGFSSCYQNACIAAQEFENVFVVDSMNLSTGQGHVVVEAAIKAAEDYPIDCILECLAYMIPKIRASFLLDRLDYMAKGGRCSAVMALGANLLKFKPCIEVENGKMRVGKKYRGTLKRCLMQYIDDKLENSNKIVPQRAFITHTTINSEIADAVKDAVSKKAIFDKVYETNAGCTISSHCGQNTLGVLFIEK
ncbi:DegV family protein [Clostridium kluyveri]|nr:DegV family protein [Clostridium kluyveri]